MIQIHGWSPSLPKPPTPSLPRTMYLKLPGSCIDTITSGAATAQNLQQTQILESPTQLPSRLLGTTQITRAECTTHSERHRGPDGWQNSSHTFNRGAGAEFAANISNVNAPFISPPSWQMWIMGRIGAEEKVKECVSMLGCVYRQAWGVRDDRIT